MSKKNDVEMEKEIIDLNLTAPRITIGDINDLMDKVEYKIHIVEGTTTTVAVAVIDGFTLSIETTACVDPKNFNADLGAKYATIKAEERAREKLWELEGYRLKFNKV